MFRTSCWTLSIHTLSQQLLLWGYDIPVTMYNPHYQGICSLFWERNYTVIIKHKMNPSKHIILVKLSTLFKTRYLESWKIRICFLLCFVSPLILKFAFSSNLQKGKRWKTQLRTSPDTYYWALGCCSVTFIKLKS